MQVPLAQAAGTELGDGEKILYAAIGVAISIVLPALLAYVKGKFAPPAGAEAYGVGDIWPVIKPYLALGVLSIIIAVIVVAAVDDIKTWKGAMLAGYAADSTLQKIKDGIGK